MAKGNGRWGALTKALGDPGKATTRRWVYIWLVLVAVGWFWMIPKYVSAQDKKEEPKAAAPAAEMAPKPAEAAKPAEAPKAPEPRNDPNGGRTGNATCWGKNTARVPAADPIPRVPNFANRKRAWTQKKRDLAN